MSVSTADQGNSSTMNTGFILGLRYDTITREAGEEQVWKEMAGLSEKNYQPGTTKESFWRSLS